MSRRKSPDIVLFERRIQRTETCWVWNGHRNAQGYGSFTVWRPLEGKTRTFVAHRYAYEVWRGPIPDGLQLDHLCRVRHCVNPDHLEAVTGKVNTLRGLNAPAAINARKTHCAKGHEFAPENTRRNKHQRVCITCERTRIRENVRDKYRQGFVRVGSQWVRREDLPAGHIQRPSRFYAG